MEALAEIFSFQGRANRAWYFWHILIDDFIIVALVVTMVVVSAVLNTPLLALPLAGVILAGIAAGVAVTVKRLHDLDRPGWHCLLMAIPLYNIYLGFVLLFQRGTLGPNRFGLDPLGAQGLEPLDDQGLIEPVHLG